MKRPAFRIETGPNGEKSIAPVSEFCGSLLGEEVDYELRQRAIEYRAESIREGQRDADDREEA